MSAMNRGMNLPAISKILMEFERESDMMDMKEGMMSDSVDDVMDDMEEEEEEGDKILKQVLDEIGVDLSQKVRNCQGRGTSLLIPSLVDGHTEWTSRGVDANDISPSCCAW
jgi:charged multivesicular body protein 2A